MTPTTTAATRNRMVALGLGCLALLSLGTASATAAPAAPAPAPPGLASAPAGATPVAAPTTGLAAAAPAAQINFMVYYRPDCAGAWRLYVGARSEFWINDTFNAPMSWFAGFGQKIRNNAASVMLSPRSAIYIEAQETQWSKYIVTYTNTGSSSKCYNFYPEIRNHNTYFKFYAK